MCTASGTVTVCERPNVTLNQFNVRPLTDSDCTKCCTHTIAPPEDEHNNARNM